MLSSTGQQRSLAIPSPIDRFLFLRQPLSVGKTALIGFTPDVDSHAGGVVNYHPGTKWLDAPKPLVVA
jgi:hypothetical protein